MIQGTNFGYTSWVPIENDGQKPGVRPPLYGQLVAADVIGRHPNVQVKALDLNQWDLSAYAVYESSALARYVVINLNEWNTTTPYARPTQRFALTVPSHVHAAEVKRLTGPGASSIDNITWGGHSWNYTSNGRLGQFGEHQSEVIRPRDGYVYLNVLSTEAVVIEMRQ